MAGGLLAQLIPTAIILAIYVSCTHLIRQTIRRRCQTSCLNQYIVCDSLLLIQIYYYRCKNSHADEPIRQGADPSEDTPLLENPTKPTRRWGDNEVLKCSLYLIFVFVAGILAWMIDSTINGPRTPSEPEGVVEWRSQILGWVSVAMFRTSSAIFNFGFCFTHSRPRSSGRSYTTNL